MVLLVVRGLRGFADAIPSLQYAPPNPCHIAGHFALIGAHLMIFMVSLGDFMENLISSLNLC